MVVSDVMSGQVMPLYRLQARQTLCGREKGAQLVVILGGLQGTVEDLTK